MLKSIRYKLIILYFMLVLIAMIIVGIFITDQLEKYHMSIVRDNIKNTVNNLVQPMMNGVNLGDENDIYNLQQGLRESAVALEYQFYILDAESYRVVASTNGEFLDKDALDVLERSVILSASSGAMAEVDTESVTDNSFRVKNMAFYFDVEDKPDYIIYGKARLDSIYKTLAQSTMILIQATFIALLVTIVLGYLVAGSITVPINQLKAKALKMASGDFRQRVEVKSDDEIGQLGRSFNYLTEKLDSTLLEISSEKSKLNAIINHMEDAVVAVDVTGRIIHHNPSFLNLLGIQEKDLQGKIYDKIISNYSMELQFGEILSKTSPESKDSIIFENKVNQILKAYPALFRDEYGRIAGAIVVIQDITESQRLENMRREFVANVSHELKTPITTIKSYTETLLAGMPESPQTTQQFLEVIEKEADRMSALVKDLLQLSQMDYKNVKWDMKSFDILPLVEESVQKMQVYSKEKHQDIRVEEPEVPTQVFGDRSKLEQVLINLISNAIKYTGERGRIRITVSTQQEFVHIQVADSGLGIPAEDLPHIFERFYRVDKGRSRAQGGTGLGLSIAKNIVEEHGGGISVQSQHGEGSQFTIFLPVYKSVDNSV